MMTLLLMMIMVMMASLIWVCTISVAPRKKVLYLFANSDDFKILSVNLFSQATAFHFACIVFRVHSGCARAANAHQTAQADLSICWSNKVKDTFSLGVAHLFRPVSSAMGMCFVKLRY